MAGHENLGLLSLYSTLSQHAPIVGHQCCRYRYASITTHTNVRRAYDDIIAERCI